MFISDARKGTFVELPSKLAIVIIRTYQTLYVDITLMMNSF